MIRFGPEFAPPRRFPCLGRTADPREICGLQVASGAGTLLALVRVVQRMRNPFKPPFFSRTVPVVNDCVDCRVLGCGLVPDQINSKLVTDHSMTPSLPIEAKRASRTILVVDDEPSILNCVRRVLERANYDVIMSPSGNQAWGVIEQGRTHIDLVLTDIVMPGSIDGHTLAAKIHQWDHSLPVLFITGEDGESAAQLAKEKLLLRKPFFPKQLVAFVDSHFHSRIS